MKEIKLFFDEKYLKYGVKQYVVWNPAVAPHIVVFGATGSGKTTATKLILARISKHIPDSQIWLNDYKGDNTDYAFLRGCTRFYRFDEVERGLQSFYEEFRKRQSGECNRRNFIICCIEEWSSYIMSLDKKTAEDEKKKLGTLLMLGRSFNVHILLCQQRCDSSYFSAGSRDQYNVVISLQNLSTEGKEMMFREYKDQMKPDRKQKTGYMVMNGANFTPFQVPFISDMTKIDYYIKEAVKR